MKTKKNNRNRHPINIVNNNIIINCIFGCNIILKSIRKYPKLTTLIITIIRAVINNSNDRTISLFLCVILL